MSTVWPYRIVNSIVIDPAVARAQIGAAALPGVSTGYAGSRRSVVSYVPDANVATLLASLLDSPATIWSVAGVDCRFAGGVHINQRGFDFQLITVDFLEI